jgi:hypothetical protein
MPDAKQLSQELSERGYGQLAEQVTGARKRKPKKPSAKQLTELKMAEVIAKYLSEPAQYGSLQDDAKTIAGDYIYDAIYGALDPKTLWTAYFKAKYNLKYGKKDSKSDSRSGESYGRSYSLGCEVTFPTEAVTTTNLTLPWGQTFAKVFERSVKQDSFNLDAKALFRDKDWQKLLATKVEGVLLEVIDESGPPTELGRAMVKREEKIEERAWDKGHIDYETTSEEWSEDAQDWVEMSEGPDMDIRFNFMGLYEGWVKDPVKVENVKVDPKNVSATIVATYAIRFKDMYFPGDYGWHRS